MFIYICERSQWYRYHGNSILYFFLFFCMLLMCTMLSTKCWEQINLKYLFWFLTRRLVRCREESYIMLDWEEYWNNGSDSRQEYCYVANLILAPNKFFHRPMNPLQLQCTSELLVPALEKTIDELQRILGTGAHRGHIKLTPVPNKTLGALQVRNTRYWCTKEEYWNSWILVLIPDMFCSQPNESITVHSL